MAEEHARKIIDLWRQQNLWLAPDWASCFGIQLEGPAPSAEEVEHRERIVAQRRREWSPDIRTWQQLQEITNEVVRRHIVVKIWHPIIVALDESEGPYPIEAYCTGVEARQDDTGGVLQSYLRLEHPQAMRTQHGFDTRRTRVVRTADGSQLINLGDLYEIQIVQQPGTATTDTDRDSRP